MIRARLRGVRADRDRGAQAVEFAIIAPVLLLLLAGIVSFGFVFMSQITLTQAAREGARAAAICGTDPSCVTTAKAAVTSHAPGITIDPNNITVTLCPSTSTTNYATVTVSYRWNLGIPPFGNAGITLTATSTTPCGG